MSKARKGVVMPLWQTIWKPAAAFLASAFALLAAHAAAAEKASPIRLAVLEYGSLAWELEVIAHHGLDRKHGFALERVGLAGTQALQVALQAGRVDVVLSDWLWVSRVRQGGSDVTFAPYGAWAGGLVVPADSSIGSFASLRGRRLGVAGGAIDKNWLLLQAVAAREEGMQLAEAGDVVFGAPPLLRSELEAGRVDAVLTYWQDVAMLEASGFRKLTDTEAVAKRLGIDRRVPFLGYVFSESWAERNFEAVRGFLAASREAKAILRESDSEWDRIAPLTRATNATQLHAVRDAYRRGLLEHWGSEERRSAHALFQILSEIGGKAVTGGYDALAAGTFWEGDRF